MKYPQAPLGKLRARSRSHLVSHNQGLDEVSYGCNGECISRGLRGLQRRLNNGANGYLHI